MKFSLPLKLGIFIILLFAIAILACFLWKPLRIKWYENKLYSSKGANFDAALEKLLALGSVGKQKAYKYFTLQKATWGEPDGGLVAKIEPSHVRLSEKNPFIMFKLALRNTTNRDIKVDYRKVELNTEFSFTDNTGYLLGIYRGAPPWSVVISPGSIDRTDVILSIDFDRADRAASLQFFGWHTQQVTRFQNSNFSKVIFKIKIGSDILLKTNPVGIKVD